MQLFLANGDYVLTHEGIDCSIELSADAQNPTAWYVNAPVIEPVRANGWVGSVAEGGSVNFRDVSFNPHGHGTHTECLGHITPTVHSVNGLITKLFYEAEVVSVTPTERSNPDGTIDHVVTKEQLAAAISSKNLEALLVRTLPNSEDKKHMQYSDTNPVYYDADVVELLNDLGIVHFLTDTPSVDRENDNGELAFHHAFWNVPQTENSKRTITEMIFVPDTCEDGVYLLNLQTAPFQNDATPSRPVLYPLHRNEEEQ